VSPTRYRISLVAPTFYPALGGVETHVAQLAEQLAVTGHDVAVLTSDSRAVVKEYGAVQEHAGYRIERFVIPAPARFSAKTEIPAPGLLRAVGRHAAEGRIIHAHNYHALSFLGAALRTPSAQLVLTPHYHGVGRSGLRTIAHRVYLPAGRWALRHASSIVAVTDAEAELLRRDFGPALAARVSVVPNGARVLAGTAKALDRPTVFTWGRMQDYKRVDLLVRAAGQLPGVDLVIAGDGPARHSLQHLSSELGLTDRVHFLGRVSDQELGDWLASDVLVASASTIEAFGLTVADALATGRPVVASPLAAHRAVAELAGSGAEVAFLPPSGPDLHHERPGLSGESAAVITATLDRLRLGRANGDRPSEVRPSSSLPTWSTVAAEVAELYERLAG
jgi:1,2-diacylglycerol 3-alpha-glucosyltransferase